jgi:hypothetical protein
MKSSLLHVVLLLALNATAANAQVLIAHDDTFGIRFGEPLVVEPTGVMENDTLDGEPAGENGALATLVTDVNFGTLVLSSVGSFTYSPGPTFDGTDEFVYRADFGGASAEATVTLSACEGGPEIFTCWNENAYLAMAVYWGFNWFEESFEDDAVWGSVRTPFALPDVSSGGIRWQSNHPDPPASNLITTSTGAARTGTWGVYDSRHGYATGTELECNVDVPPEPCLFHDGFTGVLEPGLEPLFGVGGYVTGFHGAKVGISLDGGLPIGGGLVGSGYQFFGVIDLSGLGFTQFEFRELGGKIGQALFIWGDDFTLLTPIPTAAPPPASGTLVSFAGASPNPSFGNTTLHFSLPTRANVQLKLYDVRGRLVRQLADGARGAGPQVISWDGRADNGAKVVAGVYYARLAVGQDVLTQRIVVLR